MDLRSGLRLTALFPVLLSACAGSIALHTLAEPPKSTDVCEAASIGGFLAPDAAYGLGLRDGEGKVHGVIWPYGFTGRRDINGVLLIDPSGNVVAREGDKIAMRGAYGDDGTQHPCSDPALQVEHT